MEPPLVYVLVINWNGMQHLQACFDALIASSFPNARFLLIDNASTDGSVGFVRDTYGTDARVEILECAGNLGWAGGNNAGMEKALENGADYVFLLNNDTAMAPDAIERLVAAAEADPEVGGLAPKMVMFDQPRLLNSVGLECSLIGASWDLGIGRLDAPRWNEVRPVIGICGGAAFYRVAALRKSGLLPEDFEIYLDDLDLSLRIWGAGYKIHTCPGASVRHKFSATMGEGKRARRKYYLNTRNRFRIVMLNFPLVPLLWVIPLYKLGEIRAVARAVLDGEPWRAWAHVKSWGAAVAYGPRALAERWRRRAFEPRRFWSLVRRDRMFFKGVDFPESGWYAEREIEGRKVRPISDRAECPVEGGRLRVCLTNCYPHLGCASVEVSQDGTVLARLEAQHDDEALLAAEAGTLEFVSRHIFTAEDTGETMDIGGWIAVERA